ncbi:MAG: hypothetical protein LBL47_04170 [Lactobacillus sp.]|jgi:hypothetical protein|nr:hypothetical protein [Lactobacillus sp.]
MLCIKVKKLTILTIMLFAVSSVLFAADSHAQLFGELIGSGNKIFYGMRNIIYAVAGFGIIAIAIGGFFGNLNWKWLSAVIIGLMIIALTVALLTYMVDGNTNGAVTITDTLISG